MSLSSKFGGGSGKPADTDNWHKAAEGTLGPRPLSFHFSRTGLGSSKSARPGEFKGDIGGSGTLRGAFAVFLTGTALGSGILAGLMAALMTGGVAGAGTLDGAITTGGASPGANWYDAAEYSLMSAGADFNNDRYFLPAVVEAVQNGSMSTDTAWVKGFAVSIAGGVAVCDNAGTIVSQPNVLIPGQRYNFSFKFTCTNGLRLRIETETSVVWAMSTNITADGAVNTVSGSFIADGTSFILSADGFFFTGTIDDVSVRQVVLTKTNGVYPKRSATFEEFITLQATSTGARSYTNSGGLTKNDLAVNAPRFTWANGKRQLRLEDQRTNLLAGSNAFATPTYWSGQGGAIGAEAGGAVGPDGLNSLFTITAGSGGYLYQNVSYTAGTTYAYSVYVRKGSSDWVYFGFFDGTDKGAYFNLATKVVGSTFGGATLTYDDLGGGLLRVKVVATAVNTVVNVMTAPTPRVSDGGTSGGTVYCGFIQFEVGAFASDYIPTTTGAVTRAIETAQFAALTTALLQGNAATVVVRGQMAVSPSEGRILLGVGTGAYRLGFIWETGTIGTYNGSTFTNGPAWNANVPWGATIAYDGSGEAFTVNGQTPATNTTVFANGTQYFGRWGAEGNYADGYYDFIGISPEKVNNTKLQEWAVAA